jgi:hypothetical protein
MRKALSLEDIERVYETLTPTEQWRIMEKVVRALRRTGPARDQALDWTGLYGLGKGLWQGEDAQNYVNRLREDRGRYE